MDEAAAIPEITATELNARLQRGDVPGLVDVREPFERDIVDLPDHGQVLIPTSEFLERVDELDPDSELVVYCRSGSRSGQVVSFLLERGFERVFNLRGGVLAWREEVDPSLPTY